MKALYKRSRAYLHAFVSDKYASVDRTDKLGVSAGCHNVGY